MSQLSTTTQYLDQTRKKLYTTNEIQSELNETLGKITDIVQIYSNKGELSPEQVKNLELLSQKSVAIQSQLSDLRSIDAPNTPTT